MNAIQEAKLKMYRAVEAYCSANEPIISANAALMTAFNLFKTKIAAITQAAQADTVPTTGITMDKNEMKRKLCERVAILAGAISAYASTVGNNTLKMEVDFSQSALMKMRGELLTARLHNIREAGVSNLAALADYGITAAQLNALQTAINQYAEMTPKPRVAISERKALTAALVALFRETDDILENRMDKIVPTFRKTNPDFVETYEATRRIVKMPTTVTQLRGTVTDRATKLPIPNAHITAAIGTEPPLTTQTDTSGEYEFKPIPHGDAAVTVTANGYQNFQAEIDILMGEFNDLDVELEK